MTKNEITAIVYKNKTELYGKNFPVGFLQKKINEVAKKKLTKPSQNNEYTDITNNCDH